MNFSDKLKIIFKKDRLARRIGYTSGIVYFFIYLISIENIIFSSKWSFSFLVVPNWGTKLFLQKVAFLWEPIASLTIGPIQFLIAIPNLLIGILLSILVMLNVLVALYTYRLPKVCDIKHKYSGIFGTILAILTGSACCAPTFLLVLGPLAAAGLTVSFITIRPFLIPASVLLMIASLFWIIRNIPEDVLNKK